MNGRKEEMIKNVPMPVVWGQRDDPPQPMDYASQSTHHHPATHPPQPARELIIRSERVVKE